MHASVLSSCIKFHSVEFVSYYGRSNLVKELENRFFSLLLLHDLYFAVVLGICMQVFDKQNHCHL